MAAWTIHRYDRANVENDFQLVANDSLTSLQARMDRYLLALEGAAGLFSSENRPTRAMFRTYASTLVESDMVPGVQGLAIVLSVEEDEIDALVADAVKDGHTDFQIHPDTGHAERFIIRGIEPLENNNESALGLDLSFEPDRAAAANISRETGEARLTPALHLVQDMDRVGFVLFRPFYKFGMPVDTPEQRKAAFLGWLNVPFFADAAFADASSLQAFYFDYWIFDDTPDGARELIFTSNGEPVPNASAEFRHQASIDMLGRDWTLVWTSRPGFEELQRSELVPTILLAGVSLSLLVWALFSSLATRNRRVELLVDERTKALQSQISLTESVMDDGLFGIFITDRSTRLLLRNERGARMVEQVSVVYTPEEFLVELTNIELEDGRGLLHFHCPRRDEERVFLVSRHLWVNSGGQGRATIIVQDVSAEQNAIEKMREAEDRLNLALSVSEVGVFDLNLETGVSVVSESWKKIMRVPETLSDIEYQRYFETRVHPDDLEILKANDAACIKGETDRTLTEFRILLNGNVCWMRSEGIVSERDKDGRALRLLGTQIDITERKRLENAKSDFIATVSHELRTPITSVKGAIQLLSHNMSEDASSASKRMMRIAMSNVDRLVLLVNDILDFEQVQSNRMDFRCESVSLNDVVETVAQDMQPYANTHKSVLQVELPELSPVVEADKARLVQVLTNLVSNACKFSPAESPVVVGAETSESTCRIFVRDQGPGIPHDFMNELFKPFAQVDRSDIRETGGTGLGLSISQRFVEQMGGKIGYRRTESDLTEFWIEMPLSERQTGEGDETEFPEDKVAAASGR